MVGKSGGMAGDRVESRRFEANGKYFNWYHKEKTCLMDSVGGAGEIGRA